MNNVEFSWKSTYFDRDRTVRNTASEYSHPLDILDASQISLFFLIEYLLMLTDAMLKFYLTTSISILSTKSVEVTPLLRSCFCEIDNNFCVYSSFITSQMKILQ